MSHKFTALLGVAALLLALGIACTSQAMLKTIVDFGPLRSVGPQIVQVTHGPLSLTNGTTSSGTAAFGSNVTSGDIVVVGFTFRDASGGAYSGYTVSVTDSLSPSTTYNAQGNCISYDGLLAVQRNFAHYLYSGTLAKSGADTVSVSITTGNVMKGGAIWAYELSGLASAAVAGTYQCGVNFMNGAGTAQTTSSYTFTTPIFLLGTENFNGNACTSYTISNANYLKSTEDTANSDFLALYYSGSAISSGTNFTATCVGGGTNGTSVLGAGFQ